MAIRSRRRGAADLPGPQNAPALSSRNAVTKPATPSTSQRPKESSFNFRIDPALQAAFTQATEADDKPAAQVPRDFMRACVKQRERRAFDAEARRQSRAAAKHRRDPRGDDTVSLKEYEAVLDNDPFVDEWKT
jgi:hypothetical protein